MIHKRNCVNGKFRMKAEITNKNGSWWKQEEKSNIVVLWWVRQKSEVIWKESKRNFSEIDQSIKELENVIGN